jgi:hypothetical protein
MRHEAKGNLFVSDGAVTAATNQDQGSPRPGKAELVTIGIGQVEEPLAPRQGSNDDNSDRLQHRY